MGGLLASRSELNKASTYKSATYPLPLKLEGTWVPIWVKLVPHTGQPTPQNPEAIYYHPIVRIADNTAEIELWSNYAAGLGQDCSLDGFDNSNKWHYQPYGYGDYRQGNNPPGEDTSQYECDRCGKTLYRDETGRRFDKSACLYDGAPVCRDCEVNGPVYAQDVEDRLALVRQLCVYIDTTYGWVDRGGRGMLINEFERQWDFLSCTESWGKPSQTRIWLDGKWSFFWTDFHETDATKPRERGLVGGLIQHGPHPIENGDGSFRFRLWDYGTSRERDATAEEIAGIRWSVHT